MFLRSHIAVSARIALVFALLVCGFAPRLHAQTTTGGSITGTVTDSSGAAIPGADVTLSSFNNPFARSTVTAPDGSFTIQNLPSGSWQVRITARGFAPWRNNSIVIAVGLTVRLNAALSPASAAQHIEVKALTPSLDPTETSPVTNIDRDRIEELPIPSRNYLNFTRLAPALATANPAFARQSPSAAEGGFSAGGLRPSSNALYIDGVDDNDEYTGLSRTELSPEAISDFQVVNHGYAAQSGGSAGGAVDVETRSGVNRQHGDAFIFVQNGALNAIPPHELVPHRPDINRLRVGLSTGGALHLGRLYYYIAAEQEMGRGEEAGDFSPQLAERIDAALHQGPLSGFHIQQGFYPTTNQETEFSTRIDRSIRGSHLMLRYALTNNRSVNDAFNLSNLYDLSSRGSAFYNDNSINGSWSAPLSRRWFNQFDFELAQRRVALRTASQSGPGVVVSGIAEFGTPWSGNSRRYETHIDLGDALFYQRGKHLMQAGVSFSHVALRAADRQGFTGLYVFPTLASLDAGQPDFFTQSYGNPNTNFGELRLSAYIQDHWTPTHSLAFDYGLRYEDNHLPTSLPQHSLNFSPRVGVAWSPNKNWVVRTGFGIFYDRYLLSTINRITEFDGRRALQQIVEGPSTAALYQSGQAYSQPLPGIAPSIWQAQHHLGNPYAETSSLSVERSLPAQWTATVEYRFVHGVKLGRTINANLLPPVILTASNAASLGIPSPTPQQLTRPIFTPQRIHPAYDAINQFQTEANSNYNGLTITVNRQFTDDLEVLAGYTYSKTIDDASYDTEQPQNPYNLAAERALSLDDQRHSFVLSGLWLLGPDLDDPQDIAGAAHPSTLDKFLYGFEFTPILAVNNGFRDNPLTGSDSNREHIYPFAARPQSYARNSLKTPPTFSFDFRALRMVPIWRGHLDIVAESFNLLNHPNVDLLNPVYGSGLTAATGFTQPIQFANARRVQFSLDYEY